MKKITLVLILALSILMIGCTTQSIEEVKTTEQVGETVSVRGTVSTSIKIGSISGYTLEDDSGSIAVSSNNIPDEGKTITVRGTLMRDTIFGYYIKE